MYSNTMKYLDGDQFSELDREWKGWGYGAAALPDFIGAP